MDESRRHRRSPRISTWAIEVTAASCLSACAGHTGGAATPAAAAAPPPADSSPAATPPADSAPAALPPAAPPPASAGQGRPDPLLVTETEYQGWRYFAVYCERCHAPDAVGTADAPDLRYSVSSEGGVTADSFKVVVRNGSEGKMKGFADLLDDQRIEQLYAYIMARSEGRLAPGRPHRAPE
jgi:mono/diheme cytochrome c family protein